MDYLSDPALQSAQSSANTATQTALNAQQAGYTLPDLLKQALTKKYSEASNPLMADLNTARQQVYSDISGAPAQVTQANSGVIFSPTQQAALIGKYRAPGIANLAGLTDRFNLETGGLQNIINSTSNAFQAQTAGLQGKAELARQSYTDLLNLMKMQSEEDWQKEQSTEEKRRWELEYALQKAQAGKGSASDQKQERWNSMVRDIQSKVTLKTLLTKYGGDFSPDEIYNVYNASSPWGPAKESADILSQLGIKSPASTQATAKQLAAMKTVSQIGAVNDTVKNKTGSWESRIVRTKMDIPGGLGMGQLKGTEADLASLESEYFALVQNALTAIQGSRPSDYDAKVYQKNLGPSIVNSPQVNEDRIANLYSLMGGETATLTDPKTGKTYEYLGTSDPDYIADEKKGYK